MRIVTITYPKVSLIVEGKKSEITLTAKTPNRSVKIVLREAALADLLGTLKLAFLGLCTRSYTIPAVEGHISISQSDERGQLQTNIRIGYNNIEEPRISLFISQLENHRIQCVIERYLD